MIIYIENLRDASIDVNIICAIDTSDISLKP